MLKLNDRFFCALKRCKVGKRLKRALLKADNRTSFKRCIYIYIYIGDRQAKEVYEDERVSTKIECQKEEKEEL